MAKKPTAQPGEVIRTTTTEERISPPDIPKERPEERPEEVLTPEDPINSLAGFVPPEPEPEEISALLAELGDADHKVVVYRYNKDFKKFARLDSYSHKEFSLDMLGDTYGGGKYRVYVFRPKGQMALSKVVEIDEAKRPKHDPSAVVQTAQGPIIVPQGPDAGKMMELMMNQANQQQALMMTMMAKITEALATARSAPAQPSMLKDVGDILALQQMFGSNKGNPNVENFNQMLSALQQGIELGKVAGTEKEEGGILSEIAKNILPALVGMPTNRPTLTGAIQSLAPRPQVTPNPPAPQVQAPAPAPAPAQLPAPQEAPKAKENDSMGFGMDLVIAMYKGPILDLAKQNFDPAKAAEMILLRIPEPHYAICLDFVSKPDRMDLVKKFLPELGDFVEWTGKVLDSGKEILTEYFKPEEVIETNPEVDPQVEVK